MNAESNRVPQPSISSGRALLWWVIASTAFHAAFLVPSLGFLIVLFLVAGLQTIRLKSARLTFHAGLLLGFSIYAPHLGFFWNIFGPGAIPLWSVLSFWLAAFLVLARWIEGCLGRKAALLLVPVAWLALEYFRGELYYLRFSWLSPGFAFSWNLPWTPIQWLGLYGTGASACLGAAAMLWLKRPWSMIAGGAVACVLATASLPHSDRPGKDTGPELHVAGIQIEFLPTHEVIESLNKLLARHPEADLFVLPEYTFTDELPDAINQWCRENRRHLIVGAKDRLAPGQPVRGNDYYNTSFVIDPKGEVVFRQAKSVPIQFFQDGQPAPERAVWESPWGRIGIVVCYDLSYVRVMDELVRLGAEALIVPTMDVIDWGAYQHRLHSRVTPIRAAEYGLPIFRLGSSGISQSVDARGHVRATAPFPGQGEMISGHLRLSGPGHLPLDRFLAPLAVGITALITLACLIQLVAASRHQRRHAETHGLRDQLAAELAGPGLTVFPGQANFLLARLPESCPGAEALTASCQRHRLFIRNASSMSSRFGDRFIRIAVKDAATNGRMLGILRRWLAPSQPGPTDTPRTQ